MGPLDALWHLFNSLLPAFGVGALAAALFLPGAVRAAALQPAERPAPLDLLP